MIRDFVVPAAFSDVYPFAIVQQQMQQPSDMMPQTVYYDATWPSNLPYRQNWAMNFPNLAQNLPRAEGFQPHQLREYQNDNPQNYSATGTGQQRQRRGRGERGGGGRGGVRE